MTNEERKRSLVKGKKAEAIVAIFLLIPPMLGVISFALSLFDCDLFFNRMYNLGVVWVGNCGDYGGFTSAAPIFLGLMAIAGVLLLKDSMRYLFIKLDKKGKSKFKRFIESLGGYTVGASRGTMYRPPEGVLKTKPPTDII